MPTNIVHEPEATIAGTDESGVPVRTLRGRVRPPTPVESVYLYGLLRFKDLEAADLPIAAGYRRERIWLVPEGPWCRYEVTDRAAHLPPNSAA